MEYSMKIIKMHIPNSNCLSQFSSQVLYRNLSNFSRQPSDETVWQMNCCEFLTLILSNSRHACIGIIVHFSHNNTVASFQQKFFSNICILYTLWSCYSRHSERSLTSFITLYSRCTFQSWQSANTQTDIWDDQINEILNF